MDKYIIPGSVIGISLITMFMFMKPKKSSTSELSNRNLIRNLGYNSRPSMDNANYIAANESIGGKRKNKTKRKIK
jgi:hypothetical protein